MEHEQKRQESIFLCRPSCNRIIFRVSVDEQCVICTLYYIISIFKCMTQIHRKINVFETARHH